MPARAATVAALLLATAGIAQGRTWTVDASADAVAQFTDLPAAVAAASDGDVILVRPGFYSGFQTGKALCVLGAPGAKVGGTLGVPAIEVLGLPAGKTFALKGITLVAVTPTLVLRNNAGRIHLESIQRRGNPLAPVVVDHCNEVTIRDYQSDSWERFEITRSSVVITATTLTGWFANPAAQTAAAAPVIAVTSSLWLSDCALTGGDGAGTAPGWPPAPGMSVTTCAVRIDGLGAVAAGSATPSATPVAAIDAPGSLIAIDPSVTLFPYLNAPPIANANTVAIQRLATLDAPGASLGGLLAPTVRSGPGDAYLLALGMPSDPTLTSIGAVFLDLGMLVSLAQGIQGPSGATSFSFGIPNVPALRGATFALQAANAFRNESRFGMTNPRLVTFD